MRSIPCVKNFLRHQTQQRYTKTNQSDVMGDEQIIQQLLAALNSAHDPSVSTIQRQQANEVFFYI